ncbi:MAG TPA: hypothetical protein VGW35_00105 [Methylomirabilota bacterium]|nr:hypothetical protein [Methylomirabilota bacterium]
MTSGSAGGLLLAAAARIAGTDPERIARLPDTTDMRNEIVIQRCDRIHYDQALRTAGARLVVVGDEECCTPTQIEAAIGERTAALIYIVSARLAEAGVPPDRMAEIAHAHMAPVAAAAQPALKVAVAISPLKGRTPDRWDPAGISGRDAREGRRREETADIPGW